MGVLGMVSRSNGVGASEVDIDVFRRGGARADLTRTCRREPGIAERDNASEDSGPGVEKAVQAANRIAELVNTHLSFRIHEESGRVYVMVIDNETNEVIRQIPPQRMLEIIAQVRELIGLILDEKV